MLSFINNCAFNRQICALCGARHDVSFHGLCEACHADLPWLTHACSRCALPLPLHQPDLCAHCIKDPPPFNRVLSAFTYTFPVSALIPAIKYQKQPAHLGWLADVLADFIRQHHQGPWPDALIPVPMHPFSQIARGYNQAELLADRLSRRLQLPLLHALRKTRRTARQMSLSLEERRLNLRGAFSLNREPPEYVALVDDVMTTGTTVSGLSRLLLEQGCKRVDVWVLARTPEHR